MNMTKLDYGSRFTLTQVLQFPCIFQRMSVKNVISQIKDSLNDDKKQTKSKLIDTIINVTNLPKIAIPVNFKEQLQFKDDLIVFFHQKYGFNEFDFVGIVDFNANLR